MLLLKFVGLELHLVFVPGPVEKVFLLPGWKVHPAFRIRLQLIESILQLYMLRLRDLQFLAKRGSLISICPSSVRTLDKSF